MPPLDDSTAPDTPTIFRPGGDGSRVASPDAWNEAAVMIAGGVPLKSVAERLGCSRTTLWRTLQRSERLRTRILEEQRFLAVEAAARFRGLHGAAVDAIETAVRRGDLRAAFWVADRLGLAKTDVGDAAAGIAIAADAAAWGEGPPVDAELFALDAPLTLEPDIAAELAGPPAAVNEDGAEAKAVAKAPPAASRETSARRRSRTFHTQAVTPPLPPVTDLLKHLPRTAAAWPTVPLAAMIGLAPPELRHAG
mgnify:CR=1 FL=1